ncbi:MAG: hypothetical protein R3344_09020 [Acidobacteriota bacterium]|nr:hypothetical protein [Acidobacteriota bacterium]
MHRHAWLALAVVLTVLLGGCSGQDAEETGSRPEAPATALTIAVVPLEGAEFDPPLEKAQLPPGVWYCDMGTVHYARGEEGDGVCPLCEMELVRNSREDFEEDEGDDEVE